MNLDEIREKVADIVADADIKLEERIERLQALAEDGDHDEADDNVDENTDAEICALIYETIIELLEGAGAVDAPDMIFACVLLAEAYSNLERYRPIGLLARKMLNAAVNSREIDSETLGDAYSRMADVLADTVYHRDYIRVMQELIRLRVREGKSLRPLKRKIKRYLALTVLTGGSDPYDHYMPSAELSDIFLPEELLDIILNPRVGHLRADPVEFTERWEQIYYDVSDELDRLLADEPRRMGFCFRYWREKERLLREAYGIEWHSPHAMNPGVMFD